MRVAFVSVSLVGGGLERQATVLAGALGDDEDEEVYLITGVKRKNEYAVSEKVKRLCVLNGSRWLMRDVVMLLRVAKKYKLDVMVGMGIHMNWLVSLARLLGCKARAVVSEMSSPKHDDLSYKSRILRKLLYWRADGYVFQTEEEREYYSKRIQKRSKVIHNPIKKDMPYKTEENSKEIVAMGRLMPEKNYTLLLKAFSIVHQKYPEYVLRIYGMGREEEKLRKFCEKLHIEQKVIFEGFFTDVHQRIVNADIYVLSSNYEGMPNALMEAMAMGFPVVATDCHGGGPRELIQDGVNGLLTPIGDAGRMADRIIELIENEKLKIDIAKEAIKIKATHSEKEIASMWKHYIHNVEMGCFKNHIGVN